MTIRHLLCAAAALVVSGAAEVSAQNCLGAPKTEARRVLGLMYAGSQGADGDEGGLGITFGTLTPTDQALRLELSSRAIVPEGSGSSQEDFYYTRLAGTLARPLGAKKSASGTTASGVCGIAQLATTIKHSASDEEELGRVPSSPTSAYSAAAGAAWALSTPAVGLYAGPLFGISSANGESAMFATMHVGGGLRLGRILLNAEMNAPLGQEGATNYLQVRAGWMW
ncbi:MAG TPA: hypothetical protein VFO55_12860 [Gemmatimonadaceae bacterium]|nr:hypothetical protein [Gemmatimonadaceae bacterium]